MSQSQCFKPLKSDPLLASHAVALDFGRAKNVNKNPVAEKSNQELELELLRVDPTGYSVSAPLCSVLHENTQPGTLCSRNVVLP